LRCILCIASSESAGLAGLAVDLRAAAALGVHAAPVVAAVTAQAQDEPAALASIDASLLRRQIEIARARLAPQAVKIGLLPQLAAGEAVADALRDFDGPIVVDPVAANAAGPFLAPTQWRAAVFALLPLRPILTPNLPELMALCQRELADDDAALGAACAPLLAAGAGAVLVKGGHRQGAADDLLVQTGSLRRYAGERLPGRFRGTGCALSTAVAAQLARGRNLETAVEAACAFVRGALADAIQMADGTRLPHLLFEFYGREGLP
jgi:hydroxymethylpyrimidine/phosphomethylpyrimidine kinase